MSAADEAVSDRPHYPELFISADAASLKAQASYVRSTILQLGLLVLAALCGVISIGSDGLDWTQIVATAAFLLGGILQARLASTKPDQTWYETRAAAESAKTLAWRYAVGGEPFGLGTQAPADVDRLYLQRLKEVIEPLGALPLIPTTERIEQITEWMRRLRAQPLEMRREVYGRERLEEAERWYRAKAAVNAGRASFWSLMTVAFEVIGALGALLASYDAVPAGISALAATVVGVATSWVRTKQYGSLASAYAVTARELADVLMMLPLQDDEAAWTRFVGDSEGAISREHTLWRSGRTHSS
jgi:hypothetical protein